MKVYERSSVWFRLATSFVMAAAAVFIINTARAAEPLSLADAIDSALRRNPEIEAVRHEVAAVVHQTTQARSGLLPQVYVSETYSRTNSPLWAFGTKLNQEVITADDFIPDKLNNPDAVDNFNTSLSLSWNLFDGGRTWIGWRQAEENEKAAALLLKKNEQQIIARAAKAYIGRMLAGEQSTVVAQALDTAKAHLKVIEDRFRGGLAVKSDVLRAQVRIADLEQQRLHAQSRILVAEAMLKAVMGRSDDTPLMMTSTLEQCRQTQGALDVWVEKALENRPDMNQIAVQEAIARKEVERAAAGHHPTLALRGSYDLNSEDFDDMGESYAIGAVLSVNLYSGHRISAETAAAKSMLSKIKSLRAAMALGVRVETQMAYHQAQSTWQSIEVARTAVQQAEEALRIVANRYQNGLLTIISLLDAQVAHQQALTQHFKAMHDYKAARIELALAAGSIDRDFQ